jgi:hypothetical protein
MGIFCAVHFFSAGKTLKMQYEEPPTLHFLHVIGSTTIFLVGGLGVGDQENSYLKPCHLYLWIWVKGEV